MPLNKPLSRRRVMSAGAAAAAAISFPMIAAGRVRAANGRDYPMKTVDLVNESFAVDLKHALSLHPDTLKAWLTDPRAFGKEDWAKFKSSGLDVMQTTLETVDDTLLDYAWHNGFLATHSQYFQRIESVADMDAMRDSDKIGIILGSENSAHFRTVDDVEKYYALGQRVSQLTYNSQNRLGVGATDRSEGGLSDYGAAVVEKMNEIGMAVDVSHCNERTTLDAMDVSRKPVLITHGTARALVPGHPRTKSDAAIRKMAESGGVMGIAFLRVFVRDREPTTIEHAVDHFDHVAGLVGVEHLAVGSDIGLYGYDALPRALVEASKANLKPGTYQFREKDDVEGLNHPRRLYDLTDALLRRGYGKADIRLILGGNARRAFGDIWQA